MKTGTKWLWWITAGGLAVMAMGIAHHVEAACAQKCKAIVQVVGQKEYGSGQWVEAPVGGQGVLVLNCVQYSGAHCDPCNGGAGSAWCVDPPGGDCLADGDKTVGRRFGYNKCTQLCVPGVPATSNQEAEITADLGNFAGMFPKKICKEILPPPSSP